MDWGGAYGSRVPVEELDKLAVLAKVSTRPRAVARKSYPSYGQHVPSSHRHARSFIKSYYRTWTAKRRKRRRSLEIVTAKSNLRTVSPAVP
ncbi:hypothetical protein QR680_018858 [Steinernema hermaphroditum]|uniref:Uncharacterized protein n=1 Tax=Steinernema hermaphroditum TaxID=289476 RepID=A0AA39HJ80_9BILA|nr:hypothetical protein QR680_018858 [Steinernema hermaphroditum]